MMSSLMRFFYRVAGRLLFRSTELNHLLLILQEDYLPFDHDRNRDEFALFLDRFQTLTRFEQLSNRAQFGEEHSGKMLGCANGFALRAVRTGTIHDIERGVMTLAIDGLEWDDNPAVRLLELHYYARKLGTDPDPIFRRAAEYGDSDARESILRWLVEGSKELIDYDLEEWDGPDGFQLTRISGVDWSFLKANQEKRAVEEQ